MTFQIGKPKYDSTPVDRAAFYKLGTDKPEQRTLTAAIAPPIKNYAELGKWSRFIKQHFGYSVKVPDNKGGERALYVTFLCVERSEYQNGNKVIVESCPECDEIASVKAKQKSKEDALKAKGATEEEIKASTRAEAGWLKEHNLDKKWVMIAKTKGSGKWGYLQLNNTCYQLFKSNNPKSPGLIDMLTAAGKDPLSPQTSYYFTFTRNGVKFNDIKDIPTVSQTNVQIDGQVYQKEDIHAWTQDDMNQLEKLPGLDTLGTEFTRSQIKELVESGGDVEVLKRLTARTSTAAAAVGASVATSSAPAAAAAPIERAPNPVDVIAALEAQLAAARAPKQTPAAVAPIAPPTSMPAKMVEDLKIEDMASFLEKLK